MNPVHVPHDAFCQVSYAQANGPVGVTLQFDHLVGTETHRQSVTHRDLQQGWTLKAPYVRYGDGTQAGRKHLVDHLK